MRRVSQESLTDANHRPVPDSQRHNMCEESKSVAFQGINKEKDEGFMSSPRLSKAESPPVLLPYATWCTVSEPVNQSATIAYPLYHYTLYNHSFE